MTTVDCGTRIRLAGADSGAGGCLVRFSRTRQRLLLLTAGHAVVRDAAQRGDPVESLAAPGQPFGVLRTWTTLKGETTVDAALVWVDPALVSPVIVGLGAPTGINTAPKVGDVLYLSPLPGQTAKRATKIARIGESLTAGMTGPDWYQSVTLNNQIICQPGVSLGGDSGAVMLDAQGRVVGMVISGTGREGEDNSQAIDVLTPIAAILDHPALPEPLELVTAMPSDVVSPFPARGAARAPASNPQAGRGGDTGADADKAAVAAPDRVGLYDTCAIRSKYAGQVEWHRARLVKYKARYQVVADATGAPWWFIGIIHALEGGFNFATHLHNGDPLGARTVHVPAGRPKKGKPPFDWEASAIDAITLKALNDLADWTLGAVLDRFEGYNGRGYPARGINSPYLWSFSNHYAKGKFVADHVYDANAVSAQCGAAVMLKALVANRDVVEPGR